MTLEEEIQTADVADLSRLVAAIGLRLAALSALRDPEPPVPAPAAQALGAVARQPEQNECEMSAEEFRGLRVRAGLTQHAAAKLLQVHSRTVVRYESGASRVHLWRIAQIRDQFGALARARVEGNAEPTVPAS